MEEEDVCHKCNEKIDKGEGSALYYCLKCAGREGIDTHDHVKTND
jgi:predicted RNA-binding Zn-ribbon protein involved in translation (DUF1610 family)